MSRAEAIDLYWILASMLEPPVWLRAGDRRQLRG
jgi:hypothetical protein